MLEQLAAAVSDADQVLPRRSVPEAAAHGPAPRSRGMSRWLPRDWIDWALIVTALVSLVGLLT